MKKTCDRPCPKPGRFAVKATIGEIQYAGKFCAEHRDEIGRQLLAFGLTPRRRDTEEGKVRGVYVAASGAIFTAAEARPWLVARGLAPDGHGRIAQAALDAYAAEH